MNAAFIERKIKRLRMIDQNDCDFCTNRREKSCIVNLSGDPVIGVQACKECKKLVDPAMEELFQVIFAPIRHLLHLKDGVRVKRSSGKEETCWKLNEIRLSENFRDRLALMPSFDNYDVASNSRVPDRWYIECVRTIPECPSWAQRRTMFLFKNGKDGTMHPSPRASHTSNKSNLRDQPQISDQDMNEDGIEEQNEEKSSADTSFDSEISEDSVDSNEGAESEHLPASISDVGVTSTKFVLISTLLEWNPAPI